MATWTWLGGTTEWTSAAAWSNDTVPPPDSTAVVGSGTVEFAPGQTLEAETIDIGSGSTAEPAELVLNATLLDWASTIDAVAADSNTLVYVFGAAGVDGVINATADDGTFILDTTADGSLELLDGAELNVANGDTLLMVGTLVNGGTVIVSNGGNFINDGVIAQNDAAFEVESGGTLNGGLFEIGMYSSLYFDAGAAPSSEDVTFTDSGGRLLLADPADFTGVINDFQAGDEIDLTDTVANNASYDTANGLLYVTDNGNVVATLALSAAPASGYLANPDGSGGTLIELNTEPRLNYTIDAADQALGADTVRAETTIDGAGVRVGIISNSFDEDPGTGTNDVANAAADDGYLPENANGTSAVTVLSDAYYSGDDNEGLAMAELVHQVAPGAAIDFATAGDTLASFDQAIETLEASGCNIIVDDVDFNEEPLFPETTQTSQDIQAVVDDGVSYFAAAGNYGSAAYEAAFTPATTDLYNGNEVQAQRFSDGSSYQTVTLQSGVSATFDLQYQGGGSGELQMALFNSQGVLVASSSSIEPEEGQVTPNGALLTYTANSTAQYQLAIYGSLPAGTTFKYVLIGTSGGGSDVAGTIDDPEANAGTVFGHALLPEVNTVGAVNFGDTPNFGVTDTYTTYYSSTGDAGSGKVDMLAPVDAATSVFAPFDGTSAAAPEAAATAALMLQADPSLTPAQITATLEETATSTGEPANVQGAGVINAEAAVTAVLDGDIACFAAGTRIATPRGLVAVEDLREGDRVLTARGAARRVVWLGHRRVDCRRHPRRADVWPVRVQAHAFARDRPARDLLLSPDHAIEVSGVLIPIRYLANGATIAQVPTAEVSYWHVELSTHDVLLAEGLPAESFLDTGNRAAFAGAVTALHPDFARRVWAERGCAPLRTDGPHVTRAHARLLARAPRLGHRLDADPGLCLCDGVRTLGSRAGSGRHHLSLPPGTVQVQLLSRTWAPAHHGEPDARTLGVALARLSLDGRPVPLDDPRLAAGWHACESGWRWTDGAATLRTDGARELAFELALPGRYWQPTLALEPRVLRRVHRE